MGLQVGSRRLLGLIPILGSHVMAHLSWLTLATAVQAQFITKGCAARGVVLPRVSHKFLHSMEGSSLSSQVQCWFDELDYLVVCRA
jgi:hypothetical protein